MTAEDLERMIDSLGLAAVCDMLADICHGKAEHVMANWQDHGLSRRWTRCARAMEHVTISAKDILRE